MRISGVTYVPRKSHRVRNVLIILFILILTAALAVAAISAYIGWNMIHPDKIAIDAISSNIAPEFKEITFTSADKKTALSGWFFSSKGSDKTIILAHGYGANRLQFKNETFNMVKSFLDKGYNVFCFDFRNCGNSSGDKTTFGYFEKEDLLGAVAKAKALGSKKIIVLGFSTGATAGILAAADSSDINAIIADSSFSDLGKYLGTEASFGDIKFLPFPFNITIALSINAVAGMDVGAVSPVKRIAAVSPRPVMLICEKNDTVISPSGSKALYSAYKKTKTGKVELWEVDGADHLEAYVKTPDAYIEKVVNFLSENVK